MINGFARAGRSGGSPNRVLDVEVLDSSVVDEQVLTRLLRRAGRVIARPALECLELLRDPLTPPQVRLTLLAALTYLLVPLDGIPDLLPGIGFSDDLMALSTVLALCWRHRTPAIQRRVLHRLDQWFPPGR